MRYWKMASWSTGMCSAVSVDETRYEYGLDDRAESWFYIGHSEPERFLGKASYALQERIHLESVEIRIFLLELFKIHHTWPSLMYSVSQVLILASDFWMNGIGSSTMIRFVES